MASFPPFYYCHHPSLLQLLFTRKVNFYDNFLSFRVFAYSSFPPHYFFLHTHNPTPRGCLQKRKEWVKPVIHCFYELFIALLNTITFCCINCILKLYVLSGTRTDDDNHFSLICMTKSLSGHWSINPYFGQC